MCSELQFHLEILLWIRAGGEFGITEQIGVLGELQLQELSGEAQKLC